MADVGRPKIEISRDEFEKLCAIHCTLEDIAGFFDCSDDTIQRFCESEYGENFAVVFKRKSAGGRVSLRRKQVAVAESGNVTMLIWLGKQHLGQTEKIEQRTDFRDVSNVNDELMKELVGAKECRDQLKT